LLIVFAFLWKPALYMEFPLWGNGNIEGVVLQKDFRA
jgi:hypothetical protein